MSIKVNKIVEPISTLYNSDGVEIGKITSYLELNDIRIQIKKNKVSGYYIIWEDMIIYTDKYGNLDEWPKGFYDLVDDQLNALVDWGKED
jgi:hypothetical protein